MSQVTPTIPRHLGLVLDGNRRWAKANGKLPLEGHRAGYDNLKTIVRVAFDRGVEYVSAYIFSTENWSRTRAEVKYLMDMALSIFETDIEEFNRDGFRVLVAGGRERLSAKLNEAIDSAQQLTRNNTKGTVVLCFNYGGHQEIADAVNRLQKKRNVTAADIESKLYHPEVPPADLIIRTSGEQRLSNFMLWRAAYAELYFVNKHWPDFDEGDLDTALTDYAQRQRRFGK